MRDWVGYVRDRLVLPELKRSREAKIVEDLARQLEDFYREGLARGMTEAEADAYARAQVKDWDCLECDLRREERPNTKPRLERWHERFEPRIYRQGGRWTMFADLPRDLLYAARMLRRNPGFTAVAVLTLALGIGANTAIFAFINGALFRPLPFPEPGQLVYVREIDEAGERQWPAYVNIQEWREHSGTFTELTSMIAQSVALTGDAEPTRVRGGFVSDGFFQVVGVQPMLGRGFQKGEDQTGSELVAVMNYPLWKVRFGADPDILGKRIQLNAESYTIVGVMPEDFRFPIDAIEVWMPMHRVTQDFTRAWWNFGRLRSGVALAEAQGELQSTVPSLQEKYPELNKGLVVQLESFHSALTNRDRPSMLLFMGAVGLVLLIACANVANLLLARGAAREKELAVRAALGADRFRLARQLSAETFLLAALGAVLGLAFAQWGLQVLTAVAGDMLNGQPAELDLTVLGFALLLTVVTGILFGIAPALKLTRPRITAALKEGGRGGVETQAGRRLGKALVAGQVALALILLVGAGLLLKSFYSLQSIEPGYDTDKLLTLEYRLPEAKYPDEPQQAEIHRQIIERVRTIPGVKSAALFKRIPFSFNRSYVRFVVQGGPVPAEGQEPRTFLNTVGTDAFRTMGIPLLRGRSFLLDDANGPTVVVINQTFAERYWEETGPIGQTIFFPDFNITATVVGVAGNVKYLSLGEQNIPQMYTMNAQTPGSFMSLAIRTSGEPMNYIQAVREAVWSVDPDQPMWKLRTAASMIDSTLSDRRLNMGVLLVFALAALLLAAIGLYGVISYAVSRRTHEIGVRRALGAQPSEILGMVLRQGLLLTTVGVGLGLAGAFGLTRFLESMLFGVTATDPWTYAGVAALLMVVALLACYVPARRATRVDPMVALRYE